MTNVERAADNSLHPQEFSDAYREAKHRVLVQLRRVPPGGGISAYELDCLLLHYCLRD